VTWQGKADHVFQWVLFPLGDGDVVTHCLSLDDLSVIAPRSRLLPRETASVRRARIAPTAGAFRVSLTGSCVASSASYCFSSSTVSVVTACP
jgi:hypothetical protein